MSLARDIALKLGSQLRGGTTTASTRLSSVQLESSSLKRPKFAAAVANKINKRLANYTVKSLTLSKRDSTDLVITCEIHPAGATN
jgi:hypothetical protein